MNRNTSSMPHNAARPISTRQFVLFAIIGLLIGTQAFIYGPTTTLSTIIGCVIVFYGLFVGFKVVISLAAGRAQEWIDRLNALLPLQDDELGRYAVLVPAYDEPQNVMRRVTEALSKLDYPAEKVTFFILMEENDPDTIEAFNNLGLGVNFVGVESPIVKPFTKPKACNWAYQQYVRGNGYDFLVIYDAEDRPDLSQLRKAATVFAYLKRSGADNVACLQAELAFWNPRPSRVATMYWGEYDRHFNATLRGLDQLKLIPPLGGTSNHFLVSALEDVARYNGERTLYAENGMRYKLTGPWDENNVTEDADLAMRLARLGYRVRMLNSVTYEEAPSKLSVSRKQRTRWLFGFSQTFFVWLQQMRETVRKVGFFRWATYELLVGGTPLSLFMNPITWAGLITYTAARLANATDIALYMERLFPSPIYYIGMLVAIAGNCFLWMQKLATPVRRQELSESVAGQQSNDLAEHLALQEYGLTARLYLTPMWWGFTSIPAWRAAWQFTRLLISGTPKWEKTPHGADMDREDSLERRQANQPEQLTTENHPSSTSTTLAPEPEGEIENR